MPASSGHLLISTLPRLAVNWQGNSAGSEAIVFSSVKRQWIASLGAILLLTLVAYSRGALQPLIRLCSAHVMECPPVVRQRWENMTVEQRRTEILCLLLTHKLHPRKTTRIEAMRELLMIRTLAPIDLDEARAETGRWVERTTALHLAWYCPPHDPRREGCQLWELQRMLGAVARSEQRLFTIANPTESDLAWLARRQLLAPPLRFRAGVPLQDLTTFLRMTADEKYRHVTRLVDACANGRPWDLDTLHEPLIALAPMAQPVFERILADCLARRRIEVIHLSHRVDNHAKNIRKLDKLIRSTRLYLLDKPTERTAAPEPAGSCDPADWDTIAPTIWQFVPPPAAPSPPGHRPSGLSSEPDGDSAYGRTMAGELSIRHTNPAMRHNRFDWVSANVISPLFKAVLSHLANLSPTNWVMSIQCSVDSLGSEWARRRGFARAKVVSQIEWIVRSVKDDQNERRCSMSSKQNKPVKECRLGRVKAVVWANESDNGTRFSVQLRRIFKRDGSEEWEQTDSFNRDDLPLVAKVADQAHSFIFEQAQQDAS